MANPQTTKIKPPQAKTKQPSLLFLSRLGKPIAHQMIASRAKPRFWNKMVEPPSQGMSSIPWQDSASTFPNLASNLLTFKKQQHSQDPKLS